MGDLNYIIARGQDHSKDCCASLPFAGDSVKCSVCGTNGLRRTT